MPVSGFLSFNVTYWQQFGDFSGDPGSIHRLHDIGNILIRDSCFFGQSRHRDRFHEEQKGAGRGDAAMKTIDIWREVVGG